MSVWNHSAVPPSPGGSSPRTDSGMTLSRIPIPAPAARHWGSIAAVRSGMMSGCSNMPMPPRARPACSRRCAPTLRPARSPDTKTKRCWIGWPNAWPRIRGARQTPRERRAPVWLSEAMDGPGYIPDAQIGKRAHRVQPDGHRLHSTPGDHPRRYPGDDRDYEAVTGSRFSQHPPQIAFRDTTGLSKPRPSAILQCPGENQRSQWKPDTKPKPRRVFTLSVTGAPPRSAGAAIRRSWLRSSC